MSSDKFFIAILSHKGSNHREKQRKHLLETDHENLIFYYFIGDPSISEEYKVDENNNIVYLKVPDNYESLPLKTQAAVSFVNKNYSDTIKGMIKTDDDIDLDLEKIYSCLSAYGDKDYFGIVTQIINPENLSGWHMGKCESEELNRTPVRIPLCTYCGGGGYYLSNNSISKISQSKEKYATMVFEDAATGYALNSFGIYPVFIHMGENGFYWPNMIAPEPPESKFQTSPTLIR
jgi:hypothetical protein